jgi:hypothetical protein
MDLELNGAVFTESLAHKSVVVYKSGYESVVVGNKK